jgi:hypothetical protein
LGSLRDTIKTKSAMIASAAFQSLTYSFDSRADARAMPGARRSAVEI